MWNLIGTLCIISLTILSSKVNFAQQQPKISQLVPAQFEAIPVTRLTQSGQLEVVWARLGSNVRLTTDASGNPILEAQGGSTEVIIDYESLRLTTTENIITLQNSEITQIILIFRNGIGLHPIEHYTVNLQNGLATINFTTFLEPTDNLLFVYRTNKSNNVIALFKGSAGCGENGGTVLVGKSTFDLTGCSQPKDGIQLNSNEMLTRLIICGD